MMDDDDDEDEDEDEDELSTGALLANAEDMQPDTEPKSPEDLERTAAMYACFF